MSRFIILADDVTGACDTGVKFVPFGYRTDAWFTWEPYDPAADAAQATAVSTNTRALPPEEAKAVIRKLLSAFKDRKDLVFYKKTDSLLRGNAGAEIEAMLEDDPAAVAILCPALPDQGRSVTDGAICATLADGTAMRLPVADAVASSSEGSVAPLPLAVIRKGHEAMREAVENAFARGVRFFAADADGEEDLETIASFTMPGRPVIFAGSAGLAKALAKKDAHGTSAQSEEKNDSTERVLCVVWSISPSAISQLAAVRTAGEADVFPFAKEYLQDGAQECEADVRRILRSGAGVLVLTTADAWEGRSIPVTENTSGTAITDAFARITEGILKGSGIKRLFLTGGETAASFFALAGIDHAQIVSEPISGMVSMNVKAYGRTILAVTKSGSFGNAEAIVNIAKILGKA